MCREFPETRRKMPGKIKEMKALAPLEMCCSDGESADRRENDAEAWAKTVAGSPSRSWPAPCSARSSRPQYRHSILTANNNCSQIQSLTRWGLRPSICNSLYPNDGRRDAGRGASTNGRRVRGKMRQLVPRRPRATRPQDRSRVSFRGFHALRMRHQATSSVNTLKLARLHGPNEVTIATSVASRPRAIKMRPMRG